MRTLWALSVDAMFLSMVYWGCSGVFMWWQIKRTRVIGFGILAASAIAVSLLVVGMHDDFSGPGGRGRGAGPGGPGGQRAGSPVTATSTVTE